MNWSVPMLRRPDRSSLSAIVLLGSYLPYLLFPGLTEVEDETCDGTVAMRLIIGRDFAVTRSSPETLRSFRNCIRAHCRTEMSDIEQAPQMIPLITFEIHLLLERQRVRFWCRLCKIWIFGSWSIRSNNQSSATLWVLETCLIGGLLPIMIILITASLSSNTYNKASWCED